MNEIFDNESLNSPSYTTVFIQK